MQIFVLFNLHMFYLFIIRSELIYRSSPDSLRILLCRDVILASRVHGMSRNVSPRTFAAQVVVPLSPDLPTCRLFQLPYRLGVIPTCLRQAFSPSHAALCARRDCRGRQKEPSPGLCRKRALFIMKLCSCFLFPVSCFLFPVSLLRDTVPSLLCPQQLTFRSSAWPWISTSLPPAGRNIVSPRKKRRDSCLPSSSS